MTFPGPPVLSSAHRSSNAAGANWQATPTRFEDLPSEVLLELFEFDTWRNSRMHCPEINAVAVFRGLTYRFDTVLDDLAQASDIHCALAAARNLHAWTAALSRFKQVARQYLDDCWEAAWSAWIDRVPALQPEEHQAWLVWLLRVQPQPAECHPPRWERAARYLHRVWETARELPSQPMPWPMPWCVRELLEGAAKGPAISSSTWRILLRLAGLSAFRHGLRPDYFDVLGLDEQLKVDLAVQQACMDMAGKWPRPAQVWALLDRIEQQVSGRGRGLVLMALRDCWPCGNLDPARLRLRDAMLLVPIAELELSLQSLPRLEDRSSAQKLLLRHSLRLPPAAALRALIPHTELDPWGWDRLLTHCQYLLDRASQRSAAQHQEALAALAKMADWARHPQSLQLHDLVVQACATRTPPQRIALLAQLPSVAPPRDSWHSAWRQALESLPSGTTADDARRHLQALLPGLSSEQGWELLRPLLDASLRRLPADDLSRALVEIARRWKRRAAGCAEADFAWLLALCGQLPFYLRRRPLLAFQAWGQQLPEGAAERLEDSLAATACEVRGWIARLSATPGRQPAQTRMEPTRTGGLRTPRRCRPHSASKDGPPPPKRITRSAAGEATAAAAQPRPVRPRRRPAGR